MVAVRVVGHVGLVALAAAGFGSMSSAPVLADPSLNAGTYDVNGTFTALSEGNWAMTNNSYHDETTRTSTWTVASTCRTPFDCTGTVTSDQGWSAPMHARSGVWYVYRDLPTWEPCDDGTASPGHQMFMFYPVDPATYAGFDKTIGDSGGCGRSLPLVIEMPFKLTRNH